MGSDLVPLVPDISWSRLGSRESLRLVSSSDHVILSYHWNRELRTYLWVLWAVCLNVSWFVCCISDTVTFTLVHNMSDIDRWLAARKHHTSPTVSTYNSLWPGDAIWWHKSSSTTDQRMACCLTASSHYQNQCWLINRDIKQLLLEGNF